MNGPRDSFIAHSGGILGTCPRGVGDFGGRELVVNLVVRLGDNDAQNVQGAPDFQSRVSYFFLSVRVGRFLFLSTRMPTDYYSL